MKGSRHSIHLVLGTALALMAVSACSSPQQPSPQPSPPPGSPPSTIDSGTPESTGGGSTQPPGFDPDRASQSTGQPGALQEAPPGGPPSMGQQGAGASPQGTGPQGTGAGTGQQDSQGMQPGSRGTMGGASDAPMGVNEREACDALMRNATLHIEHIEGGVAIVARPRRGVDQSTLRQDMHKIERGIEQGAPAPAATPCDLFALARTGVVAIAETPDSIRLLVTTSDASRVQQIRRQANEFVRTKGGATKGTTPERGTPHGGTHHGGTPPPGGETPQGGTP